MMQKIARFVTAVCMMVMCSMVHATEIKYLGSYTNDWDGKKYVITAEYENGAFVALHIGVASEGKNNHSEIVISSEKGVKAFNRALKDFYRRVVEYEGKNLSAAGKTSNKFLDIRPLRVDVSHAIVVDGEIMAAKEKGRVDFSLMMLDGKLHYLISTVMVKEASIVFEKTKVVDDSGKIEEVQSSKNRFYSYASFFSSGKLQDFMELTDWSIMKPDTNKKQKTGKEWIDGWQ